MADQPEDHTSRRGGFLKLFFLALVGAGWSVGSSTMAYDQAYPMTVAGVCEIKTLPPGVVLEAKSAGGYFRENNGLFRRLFETIQRSGVPMTTPVEAGILPGTMVFYLDPKNAQRDDLKMADGVERKTVGERTVASLGIRGGYTQKSFEENSKKLREWLKKEPGWVAAGEAYAVYWNSPFTIWFLKRSEIHLPVRRR